MIVVARSGTLIPMDFADTPEVSATETSENSADDERDDLAVLDQLESDMLAVENAIANLDAIAANEPGTIFAQAASVPEAVLQAVPIERFGDTTAD